MDNTDSLKLSQQLCFPIYSVSRLLTKAYKPYLDEIGITYPQYLVLLVLWEKDDISIQQISDKLLLNTNTISPLLQRMEKRDLIERNRCHKDERSVKVKLTEKGSELKLRAVPIPEELLNVLITENIRLPEIKQLKSVLEEWITVLSTHESNNK
ncbi:MarR family winged helix-turn-helix transcriptional regulator [Nonlabens antarcticus]|uniref:MarR family winged helix-turn-helix transcriptional regulator n=1 Tax=Nonlabens antarcticus TaxID=392714 RepID=UPI0018917B3A|nr:MarR family transcriptional regulator [Nonlabens antarcticus]